jgi:ribonucleotide monophosphatase NagD (HAD superfamily)
MIGDRLYTDMKMAADGGLCSVLVLSGETSQADLKALDVQPDIVVDSVADLE